MNLPRLEIYLPPSRIDLESPEITLQRLKKPGLERVNSPTLRTYFPVGLDEALGRREELLARA